MDQQQIKQWIAEGDTGAALRQLLSDARGTAAENELLLLAARFQKYEQTVRLGTASEEENRQELNRINFALLQLADTFAEWSVQKVTRPARKWYWLLAPLAVALALLWYFAQKRPGAPSEGVVYQFRYKQHGIPSDVLHQIDSLQKAGQMLRDLSLGPRGEWAVLYGRNRFLHNGSLSNLLLRQMDTLQRLHDAEFKGLYLGANSEALLRFNRNEFWFSEQHGLPSSLIDTLFLCYRLDREIRDAAVAPDGSWVVLWNQAGFTCENVHDSLYTYLRRSSMEYNRPLKGITFSTDGGWVLLYDFNNYWFGFVDPALTEALAELRQNRQEILDVFMRRGDEWLVLYR